MASHFFLYMLGYAVVAAGVAYGMYAFGLGTEWIIAAVLIMVGIGIVSALSRTKGDEA